MRRARGRPRRGHQENRHRRDKVRGSRQHAHPHTTPESVAAGAPHERTKERSGHEPETRQDATHTGPHAGMGTHDSPRTVGRKIERRQRPAQRHRDAPASRRCDTCARTHAPRVSRRGMRAGRAAERPHAVPSLPSQARRGDGRMGVEPPGAWGHLRRIPPRRRCDKSN